MQIDSDLENEKTHHSYCCLNCLASLPPVIFMCVFSFLLCLVGGTHEFPWIWTVKEFLQNKGAKGWPVDDVGPQDSLQLYLTLMPTCNSQWLQVLVCKVPLWPKLPLCKPLSIHWFRLVEILFLCMWGTSKLWVMRDLARIPEECLLFV